MELPNRQLRLLSAVPSSATARSLESDDDQYSDQAIRVCVKEWYGLPSDLAIVLDVDRVRHYLSREYQDVFEIYARGYTYKRIARYWRGVSPLTRSKAPRFTDCLGCETVDRLIREIQKYLRLYDVPVDTTPTYRVTATSC